MAGVGGTARRVPGQVFRPDSGGLYLANDGTWQTGAMYAIDVTDVGGLANGGYTGLGRPASYTGTITFDNFTVTAFSQGPAPSTQGTPLAPPVLTFARGNAEKTVIRGVLTAQPNTAYRIELFRAILPPVPGVPRYAALGSVSVRTDKYGNAQFLFVTGSLPAGTLITAGTTDESTGESSGLATPRPVSGDDASRAESRRSNATASPRAERGPTTTRVHSLGSRALDFANSLLSLLLPPGSGDGTAVPMAVSDVASRLTTPAKPRPRTR
jgi:hypothetical protein